MPLSSRTCVSAFGVDLRLTATIFVTNPCGSSQEIGHGERPSKTFRPRPEEPERSEGVSKDGHNRSAIAFGHPSRHTRANARVFLRMRLQAVDLLFVKTNNIGCR